MHCACVAIGLVSWFLLDMTTVCSPQTQSSIALAFEHVVDLPENDIMILLHVVINNQDPDTTAMDVDSAPSASEKVPSLVAFLASCIRYPSSPPTLRAAIRKHISGAEEVTMILSVIENWIDVWATVDQPLLPSKVVKNKNRDKLAIPEKDADVTNLPTLPKVNPEPFKTAGILIAFC